MDKPLVTVITPAYNCGKFLTETIASVRSQNYPNLDYWVIDDCSTDDTEFPASNYRDFTVYHNPKNLGEQATVNEGLMWVKGKYFMIVNADDPLKPGAIQTLVEFMEAHPDVLCAYPDWDCINEDGTFRFHHQPRDYDFAWMLQHHAWLPSVGSIFRSSVIQRLGYRDMSYHFLGDGEYWLRIGLAGEMARVPATLATWRFREGQASQVKSSARAKEHVRVIDEFYKKLNEYGDYRLPLIYPEAKCWSYLVAAVVTDSRKETLAYTLRAIQVYPQLLVHVGFWKVISERVNLVLRRSF